MSAAGPTTLSRSAASVAGGAMDTTSAATPSATGSDATAAQAAWQVRVLGRFELDDGRQCLTRLRSPAAMALVARLAMVPDRAHGREELAALLWPDADAETGRNRLRQTLSLVRAVLEPPGSPPLVVADRRTVRAVPGAFWCDAVAFERSVRDGRGADARALLKGELLPGFYDEWVLDERARLEALADRLAERDAAPSEGVERASAGSRSSAWQPDLGAEGAAAAPSVAARATVPGQRLPHYLTRLVGADQQGARLRAQIQEHRLLTVLGAGGSGKTRLAVEVARSLVQAMPGGTPRFELVVFVALVGAVTRSELVDRLALALRVKTSGDAVESLLEVLEGRRLLLVLDNAEQLEAEAGRALAHLAEQLPDAHLLVTSRRPLQVDGERHFRLQALELPDAGATLAELAMNSALALFVDRARAHQPDFHLNAGSAGALVALVRWLEGVPLAIELAASHVRSLGASELLALLVAARAEPAADAGSFVLLARRGARSGSDPRHASMHAVIASSWELLTPPQRHLLGALAVLPAGATGELAAALVADDDATANGSIASANGGRTSANGSGATATGATASATSANATPIGSLAAPIGAVPSANGARASANRSAATATGALPSATGVAAAQLLLDELVEQSVALPRTGQDGRRRCTPVEAVREFALARLDADTLRGHRRRALAAYGAWARALPATPPLPTVREEMPNVAAALAAAPADGDAAAALELVLMLQSSWGEMAVPAGVLASLDALLAAPDLPDALAAGVHALAAVACQDAGRKDDVRRHRDAALARPCDDPVIRSMVLSRMARMVWRVEKDAVRARALLAEALPLARASGRVNTEAALISLEGHLATVVDGDPVRGKAFSAESLALWTRSGNRHLVNNGRYNVAVQTIEAGEPERALPELAALAAEGRELQDWDLAAGAHEARGTALLALRRWRASAANLREALAIAWEHFELQAALYALWNIAPALARLGQAELAARTMGAVEAQWAQRFGAFDRRDRRDLDRVRRFARAALGAAPAAAARTAGAGTALGDAVRRVLDEAPRDPL